MSYAIGDLVTALTGANSDLSTVETTVGTLVTTVGTHTTTLSSLGTTVTGHTTSIGNKADKSGTVDIEITDTTKGLILKTPNATRKRIKVADNGDLSTETVS